MLTDYHYRAKNATRRFWATCKDEGERIYCEEFVSHALDLLPPNYMETVIEALPKDLAERAREKHDPSVPNTVWVGVDEYMRVWSQQIPSVVALGLLKNKSIETEITAWEDTNQGVVIESVCRGSSLDYFKHDEEEQLLNVLARLASECLALVICKESRKDEMPQVVQQIGETVRTKLKPLVDTAVDDVARHWGQYTS